MEKNKKKNRKKLILASILGMGVAGAIIIPPLLMKHCSQIKQIESDKKYFELNNKAVNLENAIYRLEEKQTNKEEEIASLRNELEAEKSKLNKARAKLRILVGSEDENFDFGEKGINSLQGSLVKELRRDVAEKEETIRLLEIDLEELKDAYSELEREIEEKESKVASIIKINIDKNIAIASLLEYRKAIKEFALLTNSMKEKNSAFVDNLFPTFTNVMGIYESNSSLYVEHQNDIIKDILWISLDSEQYTRLLNGETIEREKDYWSSGDYFVDIDFFSTISLPYAYDNFDGVVPKYNISYNEILNLSDEEYIEFFFNNENLIDENYNEQIKLLNYIKDKVNLNVKLLNDSLKLVLEIYKKRNEAYVKYLYLLMNSLSFLTGAWYQNPPIMREDMDNEAYENKISAIENGPLYKLKNQIANLEERFNKAKEKINELTGSEDENFETGENGENAKPGSLIYRLRNKNQDN